MNSVFVWYIIPSSYACSSCWNTRIFNTKEKALEAMYKYFSVEFDEKGEPKNIVERFSEENMTVWVKPSTGVEFAIEKIEVE